MGRAQIHAAPFQAARELKLCRACNKPEHFARDCEEAPGPSRQPFPKRPAGNRGRNLRKLQPGQMLDPMHFKTASQVQLLWQSVPRTLPLYYQLEFDSKGRSCRTNQSLR